VPLLDYGLDAEAGAFALVFPRYACSLTEWRRAQGRRLDAGGLHACLVAFLEMVSTVARLHAAGVVHYDIKGDNFLTAPHADAGAIAGALAALGRGDAGSQAPQPRPPEALLPEGPPRRPSHAGPRSLDADGGGAASGAGSGLPFTIVLADFGEAAVFGPDDADGPAGVAGGAAGQGAGGAAAAPAAFTLRHRGSAAFMSPEMHMLGSGSHARDHAHYDRRRLRGAGRPHDVWSLGCCLYELIVGRPLFSDEPEPALRIGAALEADARRRAEVRRGGAAPRQASVLRDADADALAAALPPALAPRRAAAAAPLPPVAGPAPKALPAAAPLPGVAWLQQRRAPRASAAAPPPAPPPGPPRPPAAGGRLGGYAARQAARYGGAAGALLDLIDAILVLDAVHRPGLDEVARRAARVLDELGAAGGAAAPAAPAAQTPAPLAADAEQPRQPSR
jgi:serine/threonine protein kinase